MRSDKLDAAEEARGEAGVLYRLLDLVFGFFVWIVHFVAIYAATALACVLGLGAADAGVRSTFVTTLVIVTVAAAAIVVLHALKKYRRRAEAPDRRFLRGITIGHDAIAVIGVLYQLFPILMVPLCQ
jgi:membrane protein implicated in regulation of membrane protease activity